MSSISNHIDSSLKQTTPLLTEKEVGQLLKLTTQCLQGWRSKGDGPPFLRLSAKCIRYRKSDLESWMEHSECHNKADLGRGGVA